jgi:hypothetical protein
MVHRGRARRGSGGGVAGGAVVDPEDVPAEGRVHAAHRLPRDHVIHNEASCVRPSHEGWGRGVVVDGGLRNESRDGSGG